MTRTTATLIAALLAISLPVIAAPNTDILIFANGDRLTGEVKSPERGRLRFNTDATGTISIEWDDVASLESKQNIQVESENGDLTAGCNFAKASEVQQFVLGLDLRTSIGAGGG